MEPGTLLYDPATSKVGEYQDTAGPYTLLRPVGGGREWQADPDANVLLGKHRSEAHPA